MANEPLDNQCVKDFAVLKKMNASLFSFFCGQSESDYINRVYAIYQRYAVNLGIKPVQFASEIRRLHRGAKNSRR